ncbi:MAG: hypothetical protein COA58_03485 [Bacteroidetes bacterium]|nr:MAG: hypothetical protein COA58_03485 [Bacteroidota bacterium]
MNEEQTIGNTEESTNLETNDVTKSQTPEIEIQKEILLNEVVTEDEETEQVFDVTSLEQKSLEEIVEEAEAVLVLTPKAAGLKLKAIKAVFFDKYNSMKDEAKAVYETSKTEDTPPFEFDKAVLVDNLTELDKKIKQARIEEKERIELEKKKNLERKKTLLTKLEEIVAEDETLESISKVKEIQKEWKTIRVLPKEAVSELWDKYNLLQNKFYDNHSINIELKELDRQKNLEAKIELTKKMDELHKEKSLKRSFILLNKYHEEFKNTGPVPSESREPIWLAFKSASDSVYEAKRKVYEELEVGKEVNLKQKEILAEKAELLNQIKPEIIKDWNEKTKVFEELFAEWKKIGPVPKSNKDAVWVAFNGVRNDFYTGRKAFFKELNAGKNENLKAKEELCKKVEELKTSTDWVTTTKEIIKLQEDWKKIGPVPEKVNQSIWKRFRGACDEFFNAKNNAFAGKREDEEANLSRKKELVQALKELAEKKVDHKEAFAELKKINSEFREIGFVPHKAVKSISKAYDEANNTVYGKYSKQIEEAKAANIGAHYKEIKQSHNGVKTLDYEERKIKKRITDLNDEISSIERNMSFFAKSKTAEKMLKEFEQKITKAKKQITSLKTELVAIKNAKKETKSEEVSSDVVEEPTKPIE